MLSTRLTTTFTAFLPCLFIVLTLYISQAVAQVIPQRDDVQTKLDSMGDPDTLTVSQKADQDFLSETLILLDNIEEEQVKAEQQSLLIKSLPTELESIESKLAALKQVKGAIRLNQELENLTLDQLDIREKKIMTTMQAIHEELGVINSQLTNLQTLPERTQNSLSDLYQQTLSIRTRLNSSQDLSSAETGKLNAQLLLQELQITQIKTQLYHRIDIQALVIKQREYKDALLADEELKLKLLQAKVSAIRLANIEKTAKQDDQLLNSDSNPLIKKEQKANDQIARQLMDATIALNSLVKKNLQVKNALDRGIQTERNINEQVKRITDDLLLSRILYYFYQQLESLPKTVVKNLDDNIVELNLLRFEINQQRNQLFHMDKYMENLLASVDEPVSKQEKEILSKLLDARIRLLDQLIRQLDTQLTTSIDMQLMQQQLKEIYAVIELILEQHIFWVSSNKPIDSNWFITWPANVLKQTTNWLENFNWQGWKEFSVATAFRLFFLLLGAIVLIWKRPLIVAQLDKITNDLGRFRLDSQWHTPRAVLLAILQHLPVSMFILAAGFLLVDSDLLTAKFISQVSLNLSIGYLMVSTYLSVMKIGGVADTHFQIPRGELQEKFRNMRYLLIPMMLLILLSTKAQVAPSSLSNDVIGQTATLLLLSLIVYIAFPLCKKSIQNKDKKRMPHIFTDVVLVIAPTVLIVLLVLGYYYTALKLTGRLIESFYLIIIWTLVYRTALRGLELAARRLAYRRATAKREHKLQENIEGVDSIEEEPMALEAVSQQSLRLTKVLLLMIFGVAFYLLWSDLVAIFSYLDGVVLWHKSEGIGINAILYPISLGDILTALFILSGAILLSRNLPGLLEVLILSKLSLERGTAYTITTMLNYVLLGVGVMVALSLLGLQWDKLQWLAAALTVGIGFGLQEIVGNFVSGIIILFERPVRIGDTLTIGSFTGTVSKIRIRATTMLDFDRKEVIIPNKELVTERLINWSLSDTITRVIINVGVAYGSDLQLTRTLLEQAADENTLVLKDPEPIVYFLTFGDSTLNHELRCFVNDLDNRNPTIDALNRRIDTLFKENGIEIAFNQIDIHIKNQADQTEKPVNLSKSALADS
ncbi:MAG: potassium efflux system protein [Psychromonas sp.]|jgi:potassium efflux system protein|uniref:mechanosensitive channel MscK n=1 Tax=Psychromonas sp. TaxID=1884585 RepID=UPI0039E6E842